MNIVQPTDRPDGRTDGDGRIDGRAGRTDLAAVAFGPHGAAPPVAQPSSSFADLYSANAVHVSTRALSAGRRRCAQGKRKETRTNR